MLGVTVRTLQKWDVAGKLKTFRADESEVLYTGTVGCVCREQYEVESEESDPIRQSVNGKAA